MKKIFSIWMQPVHARMNMGDHKVWLMVMATFPLLTMGIVVMGSYTGSNPLTWSALSIAALIGLGLVLLIMFFVWFFMLVHSVAMQYSPANARLLPHLKLQMQAALALPVLLLPCLMAMLFGFRDIGASISVAWLIGVLALLGLVASIRSKWMIAPVVLVTQLPLFVSQRYFSIDSVLALAHPIVLIAFGLLMCIFILHWTFAMRADLHFQQRQKFASIQMAIEGNPQFARRSMPSFASAYSYLLKRQLARKKNPLALLPFVLGPQAHSSSTLLQIAVTSVVISSYFFFLIMRDQPASKNDELFHLFLFFPMFAVMLFAHTFVMLNAIYQTRIEQGLVSLAPRSGSQAQRTRSLLGYLLRQYFLLWTCTLVVAIVSCIVLDPSPLMRDAIYLVCFSLLPLSLCLLKNHASTQGSQDSLVLYTLMACAAIFGLALTLLMKFPVISVWPLCALIVVFTTFILIWRWHKLLAMPALFPAGRGN